MRALTLGLGCVVLLGVLALPATLRVPADYATIQAAVDAAAPGDVILVAPGIYEEAVTDHVPSSGVKGSLLELKLPG